MSAIDTNLFDTALSPQDQLDGSLAQSSLGDEGSQAVAAELTDASPQELAEETFVDLTRASQAQVSEEEFFDEDPPDIIGTQEMVSTLVNSVSAGVTEAEAEALQQVSPGSALSLLEP